ncbi:hypothetical protein [Pigmentiphaga kullae]|uniref:Sialate O-acetylesterase domain-containing protein n=1 Tax=Pigmentiphaga kullae TaxID=151784 RepID=A0A4Q7NCA7_9BURK|nr:hypothetical protein [Pigmentiphaga kullae]RZS80661.1 hypothetical protein EV675_3273 [Pigmentiphaga kullae]
MADLPVTPQQMIDARKDAEVLDVVANGGSTETIVNRIGQTVPSYAKIVKDLKDDYGDTAVNADRAENAAAAAYIAGGLFVDTDAGQLGTEIGQMYGVDTPDPKAAYEIVQNTAGGAVATGKTAPSTAYIQEVEEQVAKVRSGQVSGMTMVRAGDGTAMALPEQPAGYWRMLIDGVACAVPFYRYVEPIDLMIIGGESNAEGRGVSALSPVGVNGLYISGSTISEPLVDPVGGAVTGSMWPSFCNRYFDRTKLRSAYVEAARGGTTLLAAADSGSGNWSPTGAMRTTLVNAARAAINAIAASGTFYLRNVHILFNLGLNDAGKVNGTTVTGALFEAALVELAAYFKAQIPELISVGVIQIGRRFDQDKQPGGFEIRAAIEAACASDDLLQLISRSAYSFQARKMMIDPEHWDQTGLNINGYVSANGLVDGQLPIAPAPVVLATTAYPDPSYDATTGRSADHSTAAGTKTLVIAVSYQRPGASTTFTISGVTFGGVALVEADQIAAVSASPTSRCNTGIWYITESAFGGSLGGLTASVEIVSAVAGNIIDWCVIELDAECVPDSRHSGTVNSAATDNVSLQITPSMPQVVVAIGASASGSAPLTATMTGATEVMDHGLANGDNTRAGQVVVGTYTAAAAELMRTITATWSAVCLNLGIVAIGFRRKVDGE